MRPVLMQGNRKSRPLGTADIATCFTLSPFLDRIFASRPAAGNRDAFFVSLRRVTVTDLESDQKHIQSTFCFKGTFSKIMPGLNNWTVKHAGGHHLH